MSTYKNLIGKDVNFLTTDPDNEQAEGQIWYNSTAGVFKDVISTNAWSSGGSMITNRYEIAGFGTQTAAVMAVGGIPGASNLVEEYNGTGFTSATVYPATLRNSTACGTETAGLVFGGRIDPPPSTIWQVITREYDGSSWTTGGDMGTGRYGLGGAGVQTSAVAFGGYNTANSNSTEEYNGSSWTAGNAMGTARYRLAGNGTLTAALASGGSTYPYPGAVQTAVEEYDGTNWTNGAVLPAANRMGARSWGEQTNTILSGGNTGSPSYTAAPATINYDGSSWSTKTATLGTGVAQQGSSTGTNSSTGLFAGGQNTGATAVLGVTQEYTESANVITGAAWASGGNMNIGRGLLASAGTSESAMLGAGGYSPAAPANNTWSNVEEYNGSSWSEVNNLPTIKSRFRGAGTQTAAVTFGGFTPLGPNTNYNTTEKYDGTNWTTSGNMNTARCYMAGFGIQTAAVSAGGATLNPDVGFNKTEEYNGTSWSEVNNMPNYFRNQAGVGIITAGVVTSGKEGPSASYPGIVNTTTTLEYDGTNWTAGGTGLISGGNASGGGTQSVAWFAGYDDNKNNFHYNGTSFVTSASTAASHSAGGGGAPQAAGVIFTGGPSNTTATEEFTGETSALNIKTITTS